MAGISYHLERELLETLYVFLSVWSVYHARLTEAAASDAAALNLEHYSVLSGLDKWHNRRLRIIDLIKISNYLLDYCSRQLLVNWLKAF